MTSASGASWKETFTFCLRSLNLLLYRNRKLPCFSMVDRTLLISTSCKFNVMVCALALATTSNTQKTVRINVSFIIMNSFRHTGGTLVAERVFFILLLIRVINTETDLELVNRGFLFYL